MILLLWRIGWKKSQCACDTGPLIKKKIKMHMSEPTRVTLVGKEKLLVWESRCFQCQRWLQRESKVYYHTTWGFGKKVLSHSSHSTWHIRFSSCCSDWSTEEGMTVCRMVDIRAGKLIGLQCQLWLWLTRIVCISMHCVGRSCMCDVWCVPDDKNWATNKPK